AANPAAYLPDLAGSLNNLSDRLPDSPEAVDPRWNEAIRSLRQPAARAELRTAWARRLLGTARPDDAARQARIATAEADQPVADNEPPQQLAVVLVTRARTSIRSLVQADLPQLSDLPIWASAPIPDQHIELVDTVAAATVWPNRQAAITAHRELFTAPEFRTTLLALSDLHPINPVPRQLLALLDEIDESGLDAAFARHATDHDRRALLNAWINTTTWTDSQHYLAEHRAALLADPVLELLADTDDGTARQHHAILTLTRALPDDRIYAMITDPARAEDAALDAIETGDIPKLAMILTAAPNLANRPVSWAVAAAVALLAQDDGHRARELTRAAADQATPIQRRAHTIRLRSLATRQPDLPGVADIIAILAEHADDTTA
ncbi:MAG: hypothetical protein L0H84_21050, partial [Pseudonocardia sp.]|nr:hypothetical protein [Pseudonocardia sp.]